MLNFRRKGNNDAFRVDRWDMRERTPHTSEEQSPIASISSPGSEHTHDSRSQMSWTRTANLKRNPIFQHHANLPNAKPVTTPNTHTFSASWPQSVRFVSLCWPLNLSMEKEERNRRTAFELHLAGHLRKFESQF